MSRKARILTMMALVLSLALVVTTMVPAPANSNLMIIHREILLGQFACILIAGTIVVAHK